jgi:hypothetical protein
MEGPLPKPEELIKADDFPDTPITQPSETIPGTAKQVFFGEKNMPDLVGDYDIIGFDLENTLIKFNNKELASLLIEGHLSELVESYGYPNEILSFDYDEHLSLCMNNSVWDIENGIVLKLAENKEIFHAMFGLSKISD